MTKPEELDVLQLIAEQSPDGMGVPASSLEPWIDAETVRSLQLEGLVEVVDDDGETTVAVTQEGRFVLQPKKSL